MNESKLKVRLGNLKKTLNSYQSYFVQPSSKEEKDGISVYGIGKWENDNLILNKYEARALYDTLRRFIFKVSDKYDNK